VPKVTWSPYEAAAALERLADVVRVGDLGAGEAHGAAVLRRMEGAGVALRTAGGVPLAYTRGSFGIISIVRAVGYVRVSTAEQADSGLGLAAQRQTIERACEAKGWTLVAIHEDAGASAKTMRRPGVEAAVAAVESGDAEAVVVAKLDRLSRSLVDFANVMERSRKAGWALVALDLGVDTSTPNGEMVASIMASFAQFERRLIGARTTEALAVKRARGERLGRARTMPDELVRRIKRMRSRGQTFQSIATTLNDEGVPTAQGGAQWYPATVRKVVLGTPTKRPRKAP
jgi:DNA invertase Pin-like site-specific DNA recombinase